MEANNMSGLKVFSSKDHKIVWGETLSYLREMKSETVDLVFADPPYNIGKNFDGYGDTVNEPEYFDWSYEWIDEVIRILKPDGTFYLMNSTQNIPALDIFCRGKLHIMSRIVWSYDSSGVQAKKFFGSMYEPILHMVKDQKNYTFNSKEILVEAKTGAKRGLIDYRKNPPQPYNTTKVPGNVWEFPRVRFLMDEYENHPSQKPEALMERIIKASSNPGDTILDPFAGSFTTGAVAKKLERKSICVEQNETYVKIGLRRLGIESDYNESELEKVKIRKTKNPSKYVRPDELVEQAVLKFEL